MKDHPEFLGLPAAVVGAAAKYMEWLSDVGQIIAIWLGCGVAFVTLIIKIKQLRKK